jgi:Protein of unknown function (DUF3515)
MADQITRSAARTATLAALPATLIVAVLLAWLLGGFGGRNSEPPPIEAAPSPRPGSTAPVSLPAPQLGERAEIVCRALLSQLPGSVRELARRPVTAGAEQNAAYGDPAITVACGGPAASHSPEATVYTISRVCWYPDESQAGRSVWTTVDREVPVTINLPNEYEGAGDWVAEFSDTLVRTVPSAATTPSGCG